MVGSVSVRVVSRQRLVENQVNGKINKEPGIVKALETGGRVPADLGWLKVKFDLYLKMAIERPW